MLVGYLDPLLVAHHQWRLVLFEASRSIWCRRVSSIHILVGLMNLTIFPSLISSSRLLMFASGVPTAEKSQAKKYYLLANGPDADGSHSNSWRHYKRYVDQTSILIPMPPVIYKRLPKWIKQTVFLDLPMYHFDEQVDGKAAIDEAKAKP